MGESDAKTTHGLIVGGGYIYADPADDTEQKIFTLLTGTTVITSHIGTRIYPLILPQRATLPALTYERVNNTPENGLDGFLNEHNPHMIIDTYAQTYAEAKEIASHVHAVINAATTALRAVLIDTQDLPEEVENNRIIYRTSMEFSCWNQT